MVTEATGLQPAPEGKRKSPAPSGLKRRFPSMDKFVHWKQPEDGFKYEWVNGEILKTEKMITAETLHIVRNLNRHFRQTEAFRKGGELICETEAQLSPTELRIPDIAFYTENQIEGGANGTKPVTAFAIELISANDNYNKSLQKVRAYFNAGVQVVWHIFPELRSVQVFTSPTAVTICEGDAICSVIPAIPDMQITANEVFYRKM